ncbi:hypothetical protein I302_101353 [Kwoniella bestiolae CBS 10118]|uniref:Uncharacterized protein n=1 Tax=Kwoniella bestiolae CBS 10118 TaxID=1296100 RepID=A0A1B9GBZ8_9TREE|nr:hypothetical protein I302_00036 [Kwoniella bestiolae CBS 10118]OCF28548.1 hypothetical protein I302_00036 [Kwoniella bestiolae CBS 10118]
MPSAHSTSHKKGGVKAHAASPNLSNQSPLPRLKLKIRNNSPSASTSTSSSSKAIRSRPTHSKHILSDDSSSDLTPPEEEDDDDNDEDYNENMITPRKGLHKNRQSPSIIINTQVTTPTKKPNANEKKKSGSTTNNKKGKIKTEGKKKHPSSTVKPTTTAGSSTTKTTGPPSREKKKAIKLEEVERRRARDAKFDVDLDTTYGGDITPTPTLPYHDDGVSSYGDDESDLGDLTEDELTGLPVAFVGHEIEDLNYGAGHDADVEGQGVNFWDDSSSDEDEEEVYINQLSGSEIDALSQSSVDGMSDDSMSDSDFGSSSDDGLDEFGFPIPSASLFPINEETDTAEGADPGLVLMENWDGQFVLVQPRHERSRSRHRGDKGSRTAGSVSGSTVISGTDQAALLIDPDADDGEFDTDEDSYWSGQSDEDNGGDTTDSMAEEDMPMLDSPTLNELMEAQMAEAVLRMAVENGEMPPLDAGPSITVTDPTGLDAHTPALSTTSSAGPIPGPSSAAVPQTPAPQGPVMGTFHPTTDDPAQHAVIDGTGGDTKSPFTHRRRSRRNRDVASVASSKRSQEERKRKNSTATNDPFSPASTHAVFGLNKKARYSSIPGHPRYVAARRAAEALCDPQDRETTPTDSDEAFSLEDMLETSVLMHELEEHQNGNEHDGHDQDAEHLRHMIRFDRVGVSTYLRRNFGSSGIIDPAQVPPTGNGTAPSGYVGGHLDDTLVGPMGGRLLISPVLGPTSYQAKREKKKKRKATIPSSHHHHHHHQQQPHQPIENGLANGMPALQI